MEQGQQLRQRQEAMKIQRTDSQEAPKKQFSFRFSDSNQVEEELRKPRTRAYMELFDAIDLLSATDEEIIEQLKANMDEDTAEEFFSMSMEELLEEIRDSFQEEFESLPIEVESILHGVLAKCYIDGCDCHAITPDGRILEHYVIGMALPDELEKGRKVYHMYPGCRCVEVYTDCCRVIQMDSTVVKIPNKEI